MTIGERVKNAPRPAIIAIATIGALAIGAFAAKKAGWLPRPS